MRHQKAGRKFSRTSAHRKALFSNLVASLVLHGRIETTEPKAKELKRIADRTISWGTSVGELTAKGRDKMTAEEKAKVVHAMRMAGRVLKQREALRKLFHEVAPGLRGRNGGYTRLLKTRQRIGDAAPMSLVELVAAETKTEAKAAEPEKKAKTPKKKAKEEAST